MATTQAAARAAIVRVCQRLYQAGLIAGQDGNVSVRLDAKRILVTPAGMSKVDVKATDLVLLSLDGRTATGRHRPSSEVAVHLEIYRGRKDVSAVVHAHPPTATGFAVAGQTLPSGVLPELDLGVGPVALVPYAPPGTQALARQFRPYLVGHEAWLMANHGVVTAGPTLLLAHQRMESVEQAARILLAARAIGPLVPIPKP